MGSIRPRPLKNGGTRYQAEVRLKGMPKTLTDMFNRRSDAKTWIQKSRPSLWAVAALLRRQTSYF